MSDRMFNLISNDDETIQVPLDALKHSKTISNAIDNLGLDGINGNIPLPLPNVNAMVLKKVMEWCIHHKDDPVSERKDSELRDKTADVLSEWDANFLKVDQTLLYEIIMAANYLEIKELLDAACMTVAAMIKACINGKRPDEIRSMFNIVNDFSPEEEERVRRENAWCDDI